MKLRALLSSHQRLVKAVSFSIVFALSSLTAVAQGLLVVTGPGEGAPPIVRLVSENPIRGTDFSNILAYPTSFRGGVRVAVGDVNGDDVYDVIVAPGPGMGGHVKVFDGRTESRARGPIGNIMAFPGFFQGGVYVAAGDINGDGRDDVIVAPDEGAPPLVRVFDGKNGKLMLSFLAYSPMFLGGVRVAAGDVNGDGRADIITAAGPGGGPHIKVFNGKTLELHLSFFAYEAGFLGGVYVAAGDVNNDGAAEIVTGAGPGGGPHVKVFDGSLQLLHSFFAYEENFNGGVRVAAGDVNGDGFADIITGAGPGGGPHVKVFNSQTQDLLHSFFPYDPNFKGGVYVGGIGSPPRTPRGE